MKKFKVSSKYKEIKEDLINNLISGKLTWKKDETKSWSCYFTNKSTKYIIKRENEIFPISFEMIKLINEVRLGNKKYINGNFIDK